MSDVELILQMQEELRDDPNPPFLDIQLDPFDPVAVEMAFHEADFGIDGYMERYSIKYRPQFEDPVVYDNYLLEQKRKIRQAIRQAVEDGQAEIRALGLDAEMRDPFTEDSD